MSKTKGGTHSQTKPKEGRSKTRKVKAVFRPGGRSVNITAGGLRAACIIAIVSWRESGLEYSPTNIAATMQALHADGTKGFEDLKNRQDVDFGIPENIEQLAQRVRSVAYSIQKSKDPEGLTSVVLDSGLALDIEA